jgi:hypothetical protein
VPAYERIYARAYPPRGRVEALREQIDDLKHLHGIGDRRLERLMPPEEVVQAELPL